jgi:uncharacterized protein (TIGR02646 family)
MVKIDRNLVNPPIFLINHFIKWGKEYYRSGSWSDWNMKEEDVFPRSNLDLRKRRKEKKVNIKNLIEPKLKKLTDGHCSYCDRFEIEGEGSIDHFYPKAIYKLCAYKWENLFFSCKRCNEIKNKNFDLVLSKRIQRGECRKTFGKYFPVKPDVDDFYFEKYFTFDSYGIIRANLNLSEEEKSKATNTIKIFKLEDLTKIRNKVFKEYFRGYKDLNEYKQDNKHTFVGHGRRRKLNLDNYPFRNFIIFELTRIKNIAKEANIDSMKEAPRNFSQMISNL